MDWMWQATIITGMFVLRLGVPLAITLLVGYWLHRLDARWQAEAEARWTAGQLEPEPIHSPLLRRLNQPCWLIKGCDETLCSRCPAYCQPNQPCWMAKRSPTGQLPEACYSCEILLYGQLGRSLMPLAR